MSSRSTDYRTLKAIFSAPDLGICSDDVLVDVGCGKGRVLNYWLNRRLLNRMIGIELNGEIAATTRSRLGACKNVKIITGDITRCYPDDGTLFFMYNAFRNETMRSFADNASIGPIRPADPDCLR